MIALLNYSFNSISNHRQTRMRCSKSFRNYGIWLFAIYALFIVFYKKSTTIEQKQSVTPTIFTQTLRIIRVNGCLWATFCSSLVCVWLYLYNTRKINRKWSENRKAILHKKYLLMNSLRRSTLDLVSKSSVLNNKL